MHFHKKIDLKLGCKRPSMLKVIALYSTATEPKLVCCQPHAQTFKSDVLGTESGCSIQRLFTCKVLHALISNFHAKYITIQR